MYKLLNYFIPSKKNNVPTDDTGTNLLINKKTEPDISISVAESVTAGALSNILCSEPGASQYFKGGIVTYDVASKREILGIDTIYAEKNNFANPFTTLEMAKKATDIFKTRLGIATTGYSTPTIRTENKETGECALNIASPYAIICLYDSFTDSHICKKIECAYDYKVSKKINRATVQTKVAIEGKKMYKEYVKKNTQPPALLTQIYDIPVSDTLFNNTQTNDTQTNDTQTNDIPVSDTLFNNTQTTPKQ